MRQDGIITERTRRGKKKTCRANIEEKNDIDKETIEIVSWAKAGCPLTTTGEHLELLQSPMCPTEGSPVS